MTKYGKDHPRQATAYEGVDGWGDFLTELEQRLARVGAAGLSLGLVSGTRVHTFTRGFSERTCAMYATISVKMELPGTAVLRSSQPQFFEDATATLARYPLAAGPLSGTDFSAAACLPLVRPGEPMAMGYLAAHYQGARHFDSAQQANLWVAAVSTTQALQRLLADARHDAEGRVGATVEELRFELAGLREAMETRSDIDQAKGMLMERFGLNADQSWELLRRISNQNNRKVASIARDLVGNTNASGLRADKRP